MTDQTIFEATVFAISSGVGIIIVLILFALTKNR